MTSPLAIFFVVSYFFCDFFLRFVLSLRNCHSFLTVGGVTSPEGTNTEKRKFLRKVGRNLQAMYYCCFTKTVTKSHQFCNPKNMWAFKTKTICVAHMCKHQFNMKFNYIELLKNVKKPQNLFWLSAANTKTKILLWTQNLKK